MTSPLNPALYARLKEEFGYVAVSQAGVAASVRYGYGPFLSENNLKMELDNAGEYYRVNCPYCGDSRLRLWVNHLWGVANETTQRKNLWLAICYNEGCLAEPGRVQELYDRVYGFRNANLRGARVVILPGEVEEQSLKRIEPPGLLLPLNRLQPRDKVITYLRFKGYDPEQLQKWFGVSYCLNADSNYAMAQDRIFIPVIMHNMLVGWQCRYPADLNWKTAGIPKYYSRPNMPRRLMLYNYDTAVKFPFVVLCEGPTDTWNVGPYAVAAFGKHLSAPQIKLLCDNWKAIVVLLDGDAWEDSEKLVQRLRDVQYKGYIVPVRLPVDRDPGDLDAAVVADYIMNAANASGVDLLNLKRETDANDTRPAECPQLLGELDRLRRELDDEQSVPNYSFDSPRDSAGRS